MKRIVVFGALALLLLLVPVVSAVTIDPGECTTVTFGNESEDVCATGGSSSSCSFSPQSFSVEPGGSETFESPYGNVTASCSACSDNSEVCKKHKTLRPGDEYAVDSGACDLEFSCQEDESQVYCDSTVIPVSARLVTDGNLTELYFDDELVIYEKYRLSQDRDISLEFECPIEVSESVAEQFSDETRARFCGYLMDGFVPTLLNQSAAQGKDCDAQKKLIDDERRSCQSKLDVCMGEESARLKQMQDNSLANKEAIAEKDALLSEKDERISDLSRSNNALSFGLSASVALLFVAIGLCAYLLFKHRGDE